MERRSRYVPRQGLTVGDGFRVGFGIACWQVALVLVFYLFMAVLMGTCAVLHAAAG